MHTLPPSIVTSAGRRLSCAILAPSRVAFLRASRALLALGALVVSATSVYAQTTRIFKGAGGPYEFRVPRSVTSIQVRAVGGKGASWQSALTNSYSQGAEVTTTLAVTPNQLFYVYVGGTGQAGGGGAGGFNGGGNGGPFGSGGGGGASDLRTTAGDLNSRVVVAAGGGGGNVAVNGGAAGAPGDGPGGFLLAQPGTAVAGGAGATFGVGTAGTAGSFGLGGNAGGDPSSGNYGGGGGGGWYGGGGGAAFASGAGGSSYVIPAATGTTIGLSSGNPRVSITYASPAPATTILLSASATPIAVNTTTVLTATITDQGGNPATGDEVTFTSNYPQDSFGKVTDNGDGTYSATMTAGDIPGFRTVTVTDSSVIPPITRQLLFTVTEARSLTVDTTLDFSSEVDGKTTLREALEFATSNGSSGKTITFAPALTASGPATIVLNNTELEIPKDVTITGPGADLLRIDGDDALRVLHVLSNAVVSISGVTIYGGFADTDAAKSGGGVLNEGDLTCTDCVLSGNVAGGTRVGSGGAIDQAGTALKLVRCKVGYNQSRGGGSGGAIYARSGNVTLESSTFAFNGADEEGGAISNRNAIITATNCTFAKNTAGFGGAIVQYTGSTTLNFCTVAENSATTTAGALCRIGQNGGAFNLNSTLVATNTAPAGQGPDVWSLATQNNGAFTSQGHNLIGIGTGALGFTDGVNNDQVGSAQTPLDPKLRTFGEYGGPTSTCSLQVGSPAIDKGGSTALTTDQRGAGFARVLKGAAASAQAAADVGAYELFAAPTVTIPTPLVFNAASGVFDLPTISGAAPAGGTFAGRGVNGSDFDCAAAGVGTHTITYTISDGFNATNEVSFPIEVQRYRGGAVDDAATNGSGGVILRPLANDTDGVNVLAITSVSDSAVQIGPDGRSLIVPAGYVGSFFYTVNGIYSADVTIAAASGAATIARWEGVIATPGGDVVGAGTVTRSAKGVYSAALRVGTGSATARFTLPGVAPVSVRTRLGDVTFGPHQGSGALLVQMTNNRTGVMRPILKSATAAQYNLAVAGVDDSGIPGGGFLMLTVSNNGAAKLVGTLPDGRGFSASAYESDAKTFAIYGLINGSPAKGTMGGTLTLANLASTDVTGEFTYALPQQKRGLHVNGVNNFLVANGSAFTKGTLPFASGTVGFKTSGGNLGTDFTAAVPFSAGMPTLSGPFSAWMYNKSTGAFSVKLRTPLARAPVRTVKGLFLPKSNRMWGFFPGTTVGGRFEANP